MSALFQSVLHSAFPDGSAWQTIWRFQVLYMLFYCGKINVYRSAAENSRMHYFLSFWVMFPKKKNSFKPFYEIKLFCIFQVRFKIFIRWVEKEGNGWRAFNYWDTDSFHTTTWHCEEKGTEDLSPGFAARVKAATFWLVTLEKDGEKVRNPPSQLCSLIQPGLK